MNLSLVEIEVPFELASLARASNYQRWIADSVTPFLGKRILEVGAGIGNMSQWLPLRERLFLTETDALLLPALRRKVLESFGDDSRVTVAEFCLTGSSRDALRLENFDTVVSFNVLEHIEDDATALGKLAELMVDDKTNDVVRIVSLVPAHQWAYGAMDRKYGHFRRYSKRTFADLAHRATPTWRYSARYFNVVGLPGWVVMGRLLNKGQISPHAVDMFDTICPYIRSLDDFAHKVLRLPFGQSLITVLELSRR